MEIECRFFATYREAVGQKTLSREMEPGTTVGDALAALEAEYEGLHGSMLDDEGEVLPQLSILLNGRNVVHLDGADTVIEADDELSCFPPVAGG